MLIKKLAIVTLMIFTCLSCAKSRAVDVKVNLSCNFENEEFNLLVGYSNNNLKDSRKIRFNTDFSGLALFKYDEYKQAINTGNRNSFMKIFLKHHEKITPFEVEIKAGEIFIIDIPIEKIYKLTISEEEYIVSLMEFVKINSEYRKFSSNNLVISKYGCFEA